MSTLVRPHNFFARFSKIVLFTSLFSLLACNGNGDYSRLADDPDTEQVTESPSQAENVEETPVVEETPIVSESSQVSILAKYNHLDPYRVVPTKALSTALVYYEQNKSKFPNKNYISLIDFSKSSRQKRFFIIDMNSGGVWAITVAHGKGSDSNHDGFADRFSNTSGSNASSLGYYKAAETYSGKHGLSLRLDGLSSTNSRARSRAIVIHGASYVKDSSVIQGRSWGCPAVSMANRTKVINALKGGTMIYAFK
ncbi:hypothetical protein D3C87_145200 [compost metagenome]